MPDRFDLETWKPVLKLLAWGIAAIMAATGGAERVAELTHDDLNYSEARAAVGNANAGAGVVAVAEELDGSYRDYEELVIYHAAREAACDAALEGFARHRDDERDFAHALEECHSEGGI